MQNNHWGRKSIVDLADYKIILERICGNRNFNFYLVYSHLSKRDKLVQHLILEWYISI